MAREETGTNSGTDTVSEDKVKVKRPKLYRVLLLNDDYTTMEFVVSVLEGIFKKSPAEAVQIMLQVHRRGYGMAGLYPREIAEAKVTAVHDQARASGFPLRCSMEEA